MTVDSIALREPWIHVANTDDTVPRELVRSVAELLHRPYGGPGYAVMRGSVVDLGLARTRVFQVTLLRAVWQEMLQRGWAPFGADEVRLNQFEAIDGQLPKDLVGDVVTFKSLHLDPFSVVFSHLYEAPENISGGTVSLVDVRSYLMENDVTLSAAFEPLHAPGHNGRLVACDEHRQPMLEMYSQTVEPPGVGELMLLLVRNDPFVGVAHEIAEVRVLDTASPALRRFYRASMAPHH